MVAQERVVRGASENQKPFTWKTFFPDCDQPEVTWRDVKPGEVLYREGNPALQVYLGDKGSAVTFVRTTHAERTHFVGADFVAAPFVLGQEALERGDNTHTGTAVMYEGGRVCVVDRNRIAQLLGNKRFFNTLGRLLAMRVSDKEKRMGSLLFDGVESRVARGLWKLSSNDPLIIAGYEDVAAFVASVRQTVGEAFRGMEENGILSCRRGVIQVNDREGLAHIARGIKVEGRARPNTSEVPRIPRDERRQILRAPRP